MLNCPRPAVEAIVFTIEIPLPIGPNRGEVVAVGMVDLEPLGVRDVTLPLAALAAQRLVLIGHCHE